MAFLDNKQIGKRLKEMRESTNLSARQFAIKAKVDQSQYAKIEKGELPITENIMEKLIQAHGLDKGSILHGINVPRETHNGSTTLNKPQHGTHSKNQGIDLIEEVGRLRNQLITVEGMLSVILSEIVPLIAKATGRSHANVFSQMKKDSLAEMENLRTLDKKLS